MLAYTYEENGKFVLKEKEKPTLQSEDDAIVRVTLASICSSDLHIKPVSYTHLGPCGLFYNAGLFEEKGWDVPTTWDEMWALGDKAKEEGIALFTYPTTGYFDAFFYALMHETMGDDFSKALTYEDGIWDTEGAKQAFDIVAKLATYTEKTTPANANDNDFRKNQQLVLDNKALFMPNGNWVIGEMEDAPKADGFEWGFTALPAVKEGGERRCV